MSYLTLICVKWLSSCEVWTCTELPSRHNAGSKPLLRRTQMIASQQICSWISHIHDCCCLKCWCGTKKGSGSCCRWSWKCIDVLVCHLKQANIFLSLFFFFFLEKSRSGWATEHTVSIFHWIYLPSLLECIFALGPGSFGCSIKACLKKLQHVHQTSHLDCDKSTNIKSRRLKTALVYQRIK